MVYTDASFICLSAALHQRGEIDGKMQEVAICFILRICEKYFEVTWVAEKIGIGERYGFMGSFCKDVCKNLSIFCAPLTAFHPQTDGQVGRIDLS